MYLNGADDDPGEGMASFLDSPASLLCHRRSLPFAVSMLLLSHSVSGLPSACLETKSGSSQPRMADCRSGFTSTP